MNHADGVAEPTDRSYSLDDSECRRQRTASDRTTARARARLHRQGLAVAERELDRALADLDLDPSGEAALEALAARLVAGVLASPDATLRELDDEAAAAAVALFEQAE